MCYLCMKFEPYPFYIMMYMTSPYSSADFTRLMTSYNIDYNLIIVINIL